MTALVSETSRNKCKDRTSRVNRYDALEVFVQLYAGGVEVFNAITHVHTKTGWIFKTMGVPHALNL